MDERLLREFLAEAEDLIEGLYGDIAELRAARAEGRARRELVARIFRQAHTVKGTASAAGLDAAGRVAHEFESLLDAVRTGRAPLDDEALEAFEEAVGGVAESLGAAARGEPQAVPEQLVARLRRLASGGEGAAGGAGAGEFAGRPPGLTEEVALALGAHERARLAEALGEGARAYVVLAEFGLADFDEQYRALSESLKESGEVVATQPFVNDVGPDRVGFRIVYASAEPRARVEERAAGFGARLSGDDGPGEGSGEGAAAGVAAAPRKAPAPPGVRVTLEELEDLISATHALFADTAGALDTALAGAGREELEARALSVRRRFFELEERLIGLRMVTLHAQLRRAARAGRAAARAARKPVEFEVAGGDARLDRSLAEKVAEPLLHLVRNAVDHGVENEDERRAAGKTPAGRVRIEAEEGGGLAVLRVSDDGRGVDPEAVGRAAASAGLIAPGSRLTEAQALRLIFRPGFSTAAEASLVSGRGVGLDVVERAVEEAGGEVRVRSERGRGTTFELRLPTTLAVLHAHVVVSGGRRYCVGASQVMDAVPDGAAEVAGEGRSRRLRRGGRELPLVELSELLGLAGARGEGPEGRRAFLVARAGRGAAVAVDGLEGEGEVLVRGLGRHAKHWRGVAGATELRDGTVALVLDLPRLLEGFD